MWPGWRKEVDEDATEDDLGLGSEKVKGREGEVTPATTPLAKESSPWIIGSQNGFFGTIGRKKTQLSEDEKEGEEFVVVGGAKDGEKEKKREGLGIFRRREKKEVDGERVEESADEA